ncbi:MAG: NUDIX domain-containing protein [Candidatus Babeliales bacterium]
MSQAFRNRFNFIAGAVLILHKDDKVLLQRRKNTDWMDGYYAFMGGGIDGGETIIQACIREAKEELGIHIDPNALKIVHVMHSYYPNKYECFSFFIEALDWSGTPQIMEPEKADDLIWVSPNNLPEKTVPPVRIALEAIEQKKFYSTFGF